MLLVQVIVGGLLLGAIYALFSSGLTLIWGMMNFINFAHGEFVMLGMYVALLVVVWLGGGPAAFGFAAAFALFVLGVVVYLSLIRHVMRGPMLAQILSTFGLALLLRYTAFWIFSANFVSLPQVSLSATLNVAGILMPVPQLVAGVAAIALTFALHLLLTRTTVGSQLLAVAEDRNAAMLMGIRPDRMQALAWGLAAGSAGIAGALMAMSYPWSPSVGETFGLTAFVVVTLGGFGSVPGAMYAGLIIGLIQALSAYWFGPIYLDIVLYALFVALWLLRPAGLLGKARGGWRVGMGPAAGRGRSRRHARQSRPRGRDRHADVSLAGPLFQHGDDRGRRIDPHLRRHVGARRRRDRLARTGGRPRLVGPHLPQRAAVLLHLSRRAGGRAVHDLRGRTQPFRLLSARDQGRRARRA